MEDGCCDFCGNSMEALGGLFTAPRAAICLGCAQSAVDALQNRSEVRLGGVTSLSLPPGSVITTPAVAPRAAASSMAAPSPAARRGAITVRLDSRLLARVALVAVVGLLMLRRRSR